jgi:hypothetical protein
VVLYIARSPPVVRHPLLAPARPVRQPATRSHMPAPAQRQVSYSSTRAEPKVLTLSPLPAALDSSSCLPPSTSPRSPLTHTHSMSPPSLPKSAPTGGACPSPTHSTVTLGPTSQLLLLPPPLTTVSIICCSSAFRPHHPPPPPRVVSPSILHLCISLMRRPRISSAAMTGSVHFWGFVGGHVCCRIKIIRFNLDFFFSR